MFTEEQLEILEQLNPYIDGENGESRKGRSQIYPLIHVAENSIYWCDDADNMVDVPTNLVGTWIVNKLFDEEYYGTWRELRDQDWERAEQVEVKVIKWQPINKE